MFRVPSRPGCLLRHLLSLIPFPRQRPTRDRVLSASCSAGRLDGRPGSCWAIRDAVAGRPVPAPAVLRPSVVSCRTQNESRRGRTPRGIPPTPAYSSTSPPGRPGCSSSSRPTTSTQIFIGANCRFRLAPSRYPIIGGEPEIARESFYFLGYDGRSRAGGRTIRARSASMAGWGCRVGNERPSRIP